jgi:hypothetical protein
MTWSGTGVAWRHGDLRCQVVAGGERRNGVFGGADEEGLVTDLDQQQ